jgi:acetyltransferase-like isoleucine patch superfamily enzyme
LGKYTISGGFIHMQSSNHGIKKSEHIWTQPHFYGKIIIGEDVWLGANSTILKGVSIGNGAIVAAKSVVTKSVEEYGIMMGIPAKLTGHRTDDDE